uniref:Uncharacterized protein n=1 Tax=Vitis vinifera TaxID=29760 RepID=A5AK16_VITVI|nr:hypothetical protein VITISV_028149 [Vitis vinifera]
MPHVLLGNPDGVAPDSDAWHNSFHSGKNSIRLTFHLLRIFHIRNSVRRHFTSRYLIAGWERRTFQLPRSDMSGSSDNAYPESFSLNIQCRGSQKSNASNGVQFGAEMKELQSLEAKHRKLKANFAALRNQPFAAK